MNVKVIEEKKNSLVIEIDSNHTVCNLVKEELYNDENVKIASYSIDHPLVGKPRMLIETSGSEPKSALTSASQRVKKYFEKIEGQLAKEIK